MEPFFFLRVQFSPLLDLEDVYVVTDGLEKWWFARLINPVDRLVFYELAGFGVATAFVVFRCEVYEEIKVAVRGRLVGLEGL